MQIEGIDYEVNWRAFQKGTSLFFPCLRVPRARAQLMGVAKRLRIKILVKASIENGIRGLRVWRM